MIYDASVFKTHKGRKVNKYYRLQVLDSGAGDYKTWAGWRKRSKKGDGYIFGDGSLDSALGFFEKTFRNKVGVTWSNRFDPAGGNRQQGYYRLTERKFEDDSDDDCRQPDSSLDRSVQQLMELIFNRQYFADTLRELNYDTDKLPLGKLTKRMLDKGLEVLGDIGGLLVDSSVNNTRDAAIAACSDAYYNLIPHDFGQNRPPVISSEEALKKEISFIESLCDMKITDKIREDNPGTTTKNVLDCQLAGLGVHEMTPRKFAFFLVLSFLAFDNCWFLTEIDLVNVASGGTRQEEFELLREYLIRSHGRTHHLSFQVELRAFRPTPRL